MWKSDKGLTIVTLSNNCCIPCTFASLVLQTWIAIPERHMEALFTYSQMSSMAVSCCEEQLRRRADGIAMSPTIDPDELQELLIPEVKARIGREEEEIQALMKEHEELLSQLSGGAYWHFSSSTRNVTIQMARHLILLYPQCIRSFEIACRRCCTYVHDM